MSIIIYDRVHFLNPNLAMLGLISIAIQSTSIKNDYLPSLKESKDAVNLGG